MPRHRDLRLGQSDVDTVTIPTRCFDMFAQTLHFPFPLPPSCQTMRISPSTIFSFILVIAPKIATACEGECITAVTNAFVKNYTNPVHIAIEHAVSLRSAQHTERARRSHRVLARPTNWSLGASRARTSSKKPRHRSWHPSTPRMILWRRSESKKRYSPPISMENANARMQAAGSSTRLDARIPTVLLYAARPDPWSISTRSCDPLCSLRRKIL